MAMKEIKGANSIARITLNVSILHYYLLLEIKYRLSMKSKFADHKFTLRHLTIQLLTLRFREKKFLGIKGY